MNKKYLKVIGFTLLFLVTIIYTYYIRPYVDDELFNYGFALNIVKGLVPYKDFNMIIPPLFPYLLSIVIALFGEKLLFYHIVIAGFIIAITYLSYKKLGLRSIFVYLVLLIYPYTGYNMFCLFLFFILLNLKENKYTEYFEALLICMMFLSKQTLGVLIIPSLIYAKNKKKVLAIYLTSILAFLVYLIFNNNLLEFLDYCLFGMFDFADKNGTKLKFFFYIELVIVIGLLIASVKTKRKDLFYCLMFQVTAFPIVDYVHFVISFIPVVFLTLKLLGKNRLVNIYIGATAITYFILFNIGTFTQHEVYKYLGHYKPDNFMKGRVAHVSTDDYVFRVKEILDDYSDHRAYIFGNFAYLIKLNNDMPINKFDLINNGNMGYNGTKKYIEEIDEYCSKNKCIFIVNDEEATEEKVTQTSKEILWYVKKNYTTEFSSSIFTVYRDRLVKK